MAKEINSKSEGVTLFRFSASDLKSMIIDKNSPQGIVRRAELQRHMGVLSSMGINDLSVLGKLTISGNAMTPNGLVSKRASASSAKSVAFASARKWNGTTSTFVSLGKGGSATLLASEPLKTGGGAVPSGKGKEILLFPWCYLAADELEFAAGTTIILQSPQQHLVILARKLTVGANVSLTYERLPDSPHTRPGKPVKPVTPATPPAFSEGTRGTDGNNGSPGEAGIGLVTDPGAPAVPEVQVWVLETTGFFHVDLQGQNGGQGGQGGDGGDGGNGGQGSKAVHAKVAGWTDGPGDGGDGGNGGRAGDGGPGGAGASGGQFTLYAPESLIQALVSSGINILVGPGNGGAGGMAGLPGVGGTGGPIGESGSNSDRAKRHVGANGSLGAPGVQGTNGSPGTNSTSATVKLIGISPDEFTTALLGPAVINLSPPYAKEGDTVSILGKNLAATDKVMMKHGSGAAVECVTKMFPSAAASFVVPNVAGGHCDVYIRQTDGTESNRGTVYVMPTLAGVENGPRVKPGSTVKIYGTGFSPGASVLINGVDICPPTTFIDAHTLQAVIVRPLDLIENPTTAAGEPVQLSVRLGDLVHAHHLSNAVPIILDTFRMLVFGDSTMWGNGLPDAQKFHALVEAKVRTGIGGRIGVYRTVAAHNGAIIGNGDTTTVPELNGEVPTKYPTILQQVDKLACLPDAQYVDLVLVDGGINDVKLSVIFDWTQSDSDLISRVEQYCHQDMRVLLTKIALAFPTARIINTGYFAPIAEGSNNQLWEQVLLSAVAVFGFEIKLPVHMSDIKRRSKIFATTANNLLNAAVAETNTALGGAPRIFFADPKFGPDNGVFCSDPWLWGLKLDLSPEDDIAGWRAGICEDQSDKVTFCKRSSMGHPNVKGAKKYAEAIYPLLA